MFSTPIHPLCLHVHSNPNTLTDCGQSSNYICTNVCAKKCSPNSNSNCKWVNSTPHRPLYLSPPSSSTAAITQNCFKGQNLGSENKSVSMELNILSDLGNSIDIKLATFPGGGGGADTNSKSQPVTQSSQSFLLLHRI